MATIRKVDEQREARAEANANLMQVLSEAVVNVPKIMSAVQARKEAYDPVRLATAAKNDRLTDSSERDDVESKAMKSRLAREKIGEQLNLLGEPQVTVPTTSEMPARVDPAQVSKGGMAVGLGNLIDNIVGGAGVQTETAHPKGDVKIEQGTGRQVTTTPGAVTNTPMNFRGLPYGTGAVLSNLLAKFFPGSGIRTQGPATINRETREDQEKRLAPAVASMAGRMRKEGFNSRNVQDINLENAKRIGPTNAFHIFRSAKNQVQEEEFALGRKKAEEARAEKRLGGRPTTEIQAMRARFAKKIEGGTGLDKDEQAASDFLSRTDPMQAEINQRMRGALGKAGAESKPGRLGRPTNTQREAFYNERADEFPTDPKEKALAVRKAMIAAGWDLSR